MKRAKGIYLLILAVLAGVMFSTFGKALSIDRRGLVHAMGIDVQGADYLVTVQVFKPSGAGAETSVDISQTNIQTVSGHGKTVSEAVAECRAVSGKELFFGHMQLICLGKDVDMSAPEELFAFALGDKNISPTAQICLAKDKASDIMEARLSSEETSAEALLSMLKVSCEYGRTVECTLRDMLSAAERECTILPVMEVIEKSEDSGEKSEDDKVAPVGSAVIKDGVPHELIPPEKGLETALLCKKAKKGSIVAKLDGKQISCALEDSKVRWNLRTKDGKLHLTCDIELTARPDLEITPEENDPLAKQLSAEISKRCSKALDERLKNGEDIWGIKQMIKHYYPKLLLENKGSTDKLTAQMTSEIRAYVKVG